MWCVSCIHRARQRNADNVLVCGWRFSHHPALRWKFSSVNCADRPPNAGSGSSARRGAHSYSPGLRFFRLFHHALRNKKTTSVGHRAMRPCPVVPCPLCGVVCGVCRFEKRKMIGLGTSVFHQRQRKIKTFCRGSNRWPPSASLTS